MRRLSYGRRDEQGAMIVIMSVFMVVIVAMAALVVDVGALLDERRQLQNGADAGAMAAVHSCALGSCDGNVKMVEDLANDNSRDGTSAASVTYPAPRRVRVDTSTRGQGTNILPYTFGQAISGVEGKTVRASATAAWAPARRLAVVPLAISQCDVKQIGFDKYSVIFFNKPTGTCVTGKDSSGSFGWLDGPCPATFSAGTRVSGNPGSSGPKDCLGPQVGKVVLVPVFDSTTGTGTNTIYSIVGFVAYRIAGYRFPGDQSTPRPCNSPDTCIAGTFVRVVTSAELGGSTGSGEGADFGVNSIFLVS